MKYLALCLALAGCGPSIKVGPLPPPPERLVCKEMPATPVLGALQAVEAGGALVYPKPATDARDAAIARWIVELRGAYFDCRNNLDWVRDFTEGQE